MCHAAAADGIAHMVATPHANDRYHYDRTYLQGLVKHLQELVGESPKLMLGCDFHLSYDNLEDAYANPKRYVIGDTRYLLVEFSNFSIPQQTSESFMKLANYGMTPGHYPSRAQSHSARGPTASIGMGPQGCVVQVTGSALTGFWGEPSRRVAEWLLQHQAVHVLATDAHDTAKRVPILSTARDAAAQLCGKEVADALVEANPRAIVSDQKSLPYFPQPVMKNYKKN